MGSALLEEELSQGEGSVLLINNQDAADLLTMDICLRALEEAFKEEAQGTGANRNKTNIHIPTAQPDHWYRYCSMEGGLRNLGVVALRLKSDIVSWPRLYGSTREIKHCVRPGRFCGLILLFSAKNGALLAIVNDGYVQHMRVAATGAVAARRLARQDSRVLGIIGSGGMARTHALAFSLIRGLKEIRVYSPNVEHRDQFVREMGGQLELEIKAVDEPHLAVAGADMVACCTDSNQPVLSGQWLEPGMHITCVKQIEPDDEVFQHIDRLIEYCSGISDHLYVTPEDHRPVHLGGTSDKSEERKQIVGLDKRHSLLALLRGEVVGRRKETDITYFESEGTGVQFAAVVAALYEQALEKGRGRKLPLSWFLQDIRD